MAVAAELERVMWTLGYFDVSSTATKRFSGWEWAIVVNMDCEPYLFRCICHLEGLWGRSGAHDLATEAFA